MKTVIKSEIADALAALGLRSGDLVMVHTSLPRIGYVCRDAQAKVLLDNVALDLSVNSANGVLLGCVPEAFTDNLNLLTIKRDGFTADRSKCFLSEQAESAT